MTAIHPNPSNPSVPDPSRRAESIFHSVRALQSPADRAAALDRHCAGDLTLRADIEALLRAESEAPNFLATGRSPTAILPMTEKPGARIGVYKLLEQLGEGGFGCVFKAEQREPVRRLVALKIIKLGMDTRQVVARFEQERQALAMMDHPNIARVLDAGATDTGRPYFVMELVRGVPITDYCDANNLSARDRLELFIPVCRAIQHAHQKGVIHRDVKPSNVLVTLHDGKPVPKVIDFGIAKATDHRLTEKTLFTEHRAMIGTPAYMSPEQAEMSGLDVDTRTDVYSLGVLLYELLTGTTPFADHELRDAGYAEMQRIIREVEPQKPSTRVSTLGDALANIATKRKTAPDRLGLLLRGDLDWVVMKALEKDRTRRYDTATDLAQDIQRHLSGDAVIAAPPSAAYRIRKFVRKNKGTVTAAVAIAAVLVIGVMGTTWQWFEADGQRKEAVVARIASDKSRAEAEEEKRKAEHQSYNANIFAARMSLADNKYPEARDRLDACPKIEHRAEWNCLNARAGEALFSLQGLDAKFSPDGRWIAVRNGYDADLHDAADGRKIRTFPAGLGYCFSADSTRLFTAGLGRSTAWNIETGEPIGLLPSGDQTLSIRSANGKVLTLCDNSSGRRSSAFINDALTLAGLKEWRDPCVGFSPDLTRTVVVSDDRVVTIMDAQSGRQISTLTGHSAKVRQAVFSPDSRRVLTFADDSDAIRREPPRVWETESGSFLFALGDGDEQLNDAFFSPSGARIVTTGKDGVITWDAAAGRQEHVLGVGLTCIDQVAQSPDGNRIFTHPYEGSARVWDAATGSELFEYSFVTKPDEHVDGMSFSPEGARMALGMYVGEGRDYRTIICDSKATPSKKYASWSVAQSERGDVIFSPRAGRALAFSPDSLVRLWDTDKASEIGLVGSGANLMRQKFSPDGRTFAALLRPSRAVARNRGSRDIHYSICLFSAESGRLLSTLEADSVELMDNGGQADLGFVFSDDGTRIATIEQGEIVNVWSTSDGARIATLTQADRHVQLDLIQVRFSPGGQCVAASNHRGVGPVWNIVQNRVITTSALIRPLNRYHQGNAFVAFSPTGDRVIASAAEPELAIIETETGRKISLRELSADDTPARLDFVFAQFSQDGSWVLTGDAPGSDKFAARRIWDAADGTEMLPNTVCAGMTETREIYLSPNGKFAAVKMRAAPEIELYDLVQSERKELLLPGSELTFQCFSRDGSRVATSSPDGTLMVWNAPNQQPIKSWPKLGSGFSMVCFSPGGDRLVVSWGDRGKVLTIDGTTMLELEGWSYACRFTDDGLYVTGDYGSVVPLRGIARVWDAKTGEQLPRFGPNRRKDISRLELSPDYSRAVAGTINGVTELLDASTGRKLAELWSTPEIFTTSAVDQSGTTIATVTGRDSRAQVWSAVTGDELVRLNGHTKGVRAVAMSADASRAVTGSYDTTAILWDTKSSEKLRTLEGHTSAIGAVAISPDGSRIITGSDDGAARLWDATRASTNPERERAGLLVSLTGHTTPIRAASFSPDGAVAMTLSDDAIRLWNGRDGSLIKQLPHNATIRCAAFSHEGDRIATGSEDHFVRLWNAKSGANIWEKETNAPVSCVEFHVGGDRLAVGGESGQCRILDTSDGRELTLINGHTARVVSASFTPDGSRLLTASRDALIRLSDTADGAEMLVFQQATGPYSKAWITPDGRRFVAVTEDGHISTWDTAPETARDSGGAGR